MKSDAVFRRDCGIILGQTVNVFGESLWTCWSGSPDKPLQRFCACYLAVFAGRPALSVHDRRCRVRAIAGTTRRGDAGESDGGFQDAVDLSPSLRGALATKQSSLRFWLW